MPLHIRNLIKSHLQAQLYRGMDRISISDDVRPILRHWMQAARKGTIAITQSERDTVQESGTPYQSETTQATDNPDDYIINPPEEVESGINEVHIPLLLVPAGEKETQLKFILHKAQEWLTETHLQSLRNKLIFSAGSINASIMVVNEYPSYLDEKNNNLLTGPAGEKFSQILKAMGLDRNQIYLTNLVKYRPHQENQSTNTRPPTPLEKEAFAQFIKAEAQIIKPKVILVLGESPAQTLLNTDATLTALKGETHDYHGVSLVVTYHPAFLLQSDKKEAKRSLWEDMLLAMECADMDITPKQRNFFL